MVTDPSLTSHVINLSVYTLSTYTLQYSIAGGILPVIYTSIDTDPNNREPASSVLGCCRCITS